MYLNINLNKQEQWILKMLLCAVLLISAVQSFDFNCDSECGKYDPSDKTGPNLHNACAAMGKLHECKQNFGGAEDKKKKKKKKGGDRVVGGHRSQKPMPWMALIHTLGSICGATLINNEFVLSAAHCFCPQDGLCERAMLEEEKGVPNKIKVRSFYYLQ